MLFTFYSKGIRRGPFTFEEIRSKFESAKDLTGQRYFTRWRDDEEPMEMVLYDFIRDSMKTKPENSEAFNQLCNALIVALCGGDPYRYLDADPAELQEGYIRELQICQETAPERDPVLRHRRRFYLAMAKHDLKEAAAICKEINQAVGDASRNVGNYRP
jgi:hypothetical protein